MPKTRGKLKPDDEYRLISNYSFLIQELDAEFLVPKLFTNYVLDSDDKEKILSEKTAILRTSLMLDRLLDSGPGEAYSRFIEVLKQDYPSVVQKLNGTVVKEPPKPDYSWYDELPVEVKNRIITDADASRISASIGDGWKHVIAQLGLSPVEIHQELYSQPHASVSNVITSLLIRWKQRNFRQATVDKLVSVLKEVNETGTCTIAWELVDRALKRS